MAEKRFITQSLEELEKGSGKPIDGYQDEPLVTLDEAVLSVVHDVPSVIDDAQKARQNCLKDGFNPELSAAIYLYTMATLFHEKLNFALRHENRTKLRRWFSYLKLFMTAVKELPSNQCTVYRTIQGNGDLVYAPNEVFTWWSITSCTEDLQVAASFLNDTDNCTLFIINCRKGKNVSKWSSKNDENEIILMPGTRLRRKTDSHSCFYQDKLRIIHLEEESDIHEQLVDTNKTKITNLLLDILKRIPEMNRGDPGHRLTNSIKTILELKNDLFEDLYIRVTEVDDYDWDGNSRPDVEFDKIILKGNSTVQRRQEVKTKCGSAWSTWRFYTADKKKELFNMRINQWESMAKEEMQREECSNNGYRIKVKPGRDIEGNGFLRIEFSRQ